ncbi:DELTA-stichotoxin-She4a-like [Genypterus blacodes]|uniref:DELTA-stichotoxin-She4a-like n=1 Tax=Genypterus blacodes TaxID=154954 RepID=UPI003F757DC9
MPFPFAAIAAGSSLALTAGEVGGGLLPTHRQCTIEVTNGCCNYTLCSPSEYINSGNASKHFPETISPSTSENALFMKSSGSACGSVGVFTYDLVRNNNRQSVGKMAVMFSVPYDFNLYSNWYAVGIFDTSKSCDYDLYCKMYHEKENMFVRGKANGPGLYYKGKHVTIKASMTDTYQPLMRVRVTEQ